MKVILYYPSLVIASAMTPYPSLPILSSYLKDNRNYEVISKDINVDLINKLIDLSTSKGIKFKAPFSFRIKEKAKRFILHKRKLMPIEKAEFLTLEGLKLISNNLAIDFDDYIEVYYNVILQFLRELYSHS